MPIPQSVKIEKARKAYTTQSVMPTFPPTLIGEKTAKIIKKIAIIPEESPQISDFECFFLSSRPFWLI